MEPPCSRLAASHRSGNTETKDVGDQCTEVVALDSTDSTGPQRLSDGHDQAMPEKGKSADRSFCVKELPAEILEQYVSVLETMHHLLGNVQ